MNFDERLKILEGVSQIMRRKLQLTSLQRDFKGSRINSLLYIRNPECVIFASTLEANTSDSLDRVIRSRLDKLCRDYAVYWSTLDATIKEEDRFTRRYSIYCIST